MKTFTREEVLDICRLTYDRYLTNAAGSNFSARASAETFYSDPDQQREKQSTENARGRSLAGG